MKRTRHVVVVISMAVLLILEAVFMVHGLKKIEEDYVNTYLEQKEEYLAQINLHLEYMLEQGGQQQELVGYISQHVPASGSYYGWLIKDESVIFAKNETVTASLGETQAWPVFQEAINTQETCSVSAEFSYKEENYITGMVIDRNYILSGKNLQKFKMYNGVSLSVLGLLMFSAMVMYIQRFWKEKKRNVLIEGELQSKNSTLDEMHEDAVRLNQKIRKQKRIPEGRKSYDLQMAKMLLEKSERAGIWPMYYAVFQLQMDEGQYYGKQQIMDVIERIALDERHILMEIQKGCFLVFFYRTKEEEMEQILKDVKEKWKSAEIRIKIYSGSVHPNQPGREWLDEFLDGKE